MLSLSRPRVNRSRQGSLYALERLEPRLALTAQVAIVGETLTIVGTAGADRVGISATSRPHYVRVSFDGRDLGRFGPIAKLDIEAGDGNDVVVVGPRVRLPARIDGGAGNDRLRGGSGPDLLLGGEGNDTLFGSRGRDTLDGGPGSNRVIITQSMGTIWVSASARGEATRLLAKAYTLRPLSAAGGSATGPIVVGAADLNDPATVALLKHAYEAHDSVAVANATPADVERLGSLLGHQGSAGVVGGGPKVALASFRKAPRADGQMDFSTSILMPRVGPTLSGAAAQLGRRQADEHDVERLTGFFSATPVTPVRAPGDSPGQDLLQLATSYETHTVTSDVYGDQSQIVNMVWAARSFQNQQDLYYVLQEADYSIGAGTISELFNWTNDASNEIVGAIPIVTGASPATSMSTTTETSGVSFTIGGTAGYNAAQGLNASSGAGLTISNTKTVTTPPIIITNKEELASGITYWKYVVNLQDLPTEPETITLFNQWIWGVPFTAYAAGQTTLTFGTDANSTLDQLNGGMLRRTILPLAMNSVVPVPFGTTFALEKPAVTSVAPTTVGVGQEFTITGTGFYPALVQNLVIGGVPLSMDQFQVISDTQITAVAPPSTTASPQRVVVRTAEGLSNDDMTVTIMPNS